MTTPTRLLLIFTPTINPGEFADHQTVQAVFAAAKLTTLPEVNRVIGDPMIVLPQDLHKRASETKWRDFGEASILEHLGEAFRIDYRAEQRSDSEIDCESCNAWDEIRSTLAGILGTEEKRGTARMVREVAAEVERLRIDVRHHSEQTEAVKEHFARHRKAGVEAEQAASAELEAERAKVAELEVKLQHEHLIVLACNNELELSRGRVNDLVAESPVPEGLLRCAGCGRYSEATPEQRAQAAAADAAYEAEQTRLRHEDASQRGGRGCAHSRRPC